MTCIFTTFVTFKIPIFEYTQQLSLQEIVYVLFCQMSSSLV